MLLEGIPLWLAGTNAWIVSSKGAGGECVLVDAPPEPAAILTRIAHHGLRLVALLATHGHADHVGGIKTVVAASPEPVRVHLHDGDRHMLLDPVGNGGSLGAALEAEGLDLRPPELVHHLEDGQRVTGAGGSTPSW